jgi:hypothetical protein
MELFEDILDRFDGPMTVQKLKSEIDSEAITLDKAFFSDFKNSCCFKCGKNSDVQKSLFDISMDKTMCLDPKCFRKNQTDWLKNNWPEARKKLNVATNGFVLNNDFNFSGSNTFTGDKTPVDCKKCDNFVSLLWDDYTVNRKRVCTGDKTCFKKTTVSDKNKSVDKSDLSGSGKESTGPRVAWHGEYFREEFYKTAIPENWPQLPDNLFRFKMLLLSLLKSNRSLQEWFAKTHKIRFNYGFISTAQLLKPINDMSEEQLLETVRDAAREVVMQSDFGAKDRRTVAEYIGIDLKIQWRITEEYLQKKTIKEILSMGKKFLIFEDKKAQDYLYEILGKKRGSFDTCKKAELIKVFIESGVDLAGKVPDEILNK